MQVEVGSIVEGKVTGITKFGAFVEIPDGKTGMVHISEVASTYVNEISDYLKENQIVKVKIIGISEEGKISLSIKKAEPRPERPAQSEGQRPSFGSSRPQGGAGAPPRREFSGRGDRPQRPAPPRKDTFDYARKNGGQPQSFEDMMNKFKQTSDDKMSDLKKYRGDVKRGSANRKAKND